MPRDGDQTRKKIVDAATRLFYGEGIRAVSLDAVAAKAGLTKKTIYYHFESKDDLVAAYLESRDQPTLALYQKWFSEADGDLSEKIRSLFESFAAAANRPTWRGCGFLLTIAELASTPGHPAVKAGAAHKKTLRTLVDRNPERRGCAGRAGRRPPDRSAAGRRGDRDAHPPRQRLCQHRRRGRGESGIRGTVRKHGRSPYTR